MTTKDKRHELKFILSPQEYYGLVQRVKLHPAAFYRPYPQRQINNVYFDTYHLSAFEENMAGISNRVKVRYRWYGESLYPEAGTLEVKCKKNALGWKHNYKLKESPAQKGVDTPWTSIIDTIYQNIPDEGRVWLINFPQPVIINRYVREYFVSGDQNVRVTIDTNQRVYDQRHQSIPNYAHRINLPESVVMEVKFDSEHYLQAGEILKYFPPRMSRHSKYAVGVQTITHI